MHSPRAVLGLPRRLVSPDDDELPPLVSCNSCSSDDSDVNHIVSEAELTVPAAQAPAEHLTPHQSTEQPSASSPASCSCRNHQCTSGAPSCTDPQSPPATTPWLPLFPDGYEYPVPVATSLVDASQAADAETADPELICSETLPSRSDDLDSAWEGPQAGGELAGSVLSHPRSSPFSLRPPGCCLNFQRYHGRHCHMLRHRSFTNTIASSPSIVRDLFGAGGPLHEGGGLPAAVPGQDAPASPEQGSSDTPPTGTPTPETDAPSPTSTGAATRGSPPAVPGGSLPVNTPSGTSASVSSEDSLFGCQHLTPTLLVVSIALHLLWVLTIVAAVLCFAAWVVPRSVA